MHLYRPHWVLHMQALNDAMINQDLIPSLLPSLPPPLPPPLPPSSPPSSPPSLPPSLPPSPCLFLQILSNSGVKCHRLKLKDFMAMPVEFERLTRDTTSATENWQLEYIVSMAHIHKWFLAYIMWWIVNIRGVYPKIPGWNLSKPGKKPDTVFSTLSRQSTEFLNTWLKNWASGPESPESMMPGLKRGSVLLAVM